jgi:hypothetical protein
MHRGGWHPPASPEGWPELDTGLEVGAGFADVLEGAVQLRGAGAPAVAEEAVVLAPEPGHLRAGGARGDFVGVDYSIGPG